MKTTMKKNKYHQWSAGYNLSLQLEAITMHNKTQITDTNEELKIEEVGY